MDDYVLYFIDYEKRTSSETTSNNYVLNNLFKDYIPPENIVEWNIHNIYKPERTFINSFICKNCGEVKEVCKCLQKSFYKVKAINEDFILFQQASNHYKSNFTDKKGFILHKSTTITNQSNLEHVETVITDFEYDIFYLCKWLDKAEMYEVLKVYENGQKYIKTFCPNGIQSLVFSNSGVDKITSKYNMENNPIGCRPFSQVLNLLTQNGCLISHSTTPLLFNYDPTLICPSKANLHDSPAIYDYLKLCEIQGSIHPEEPLNRRFSSDISFFWIFIVLLVVILTLVVNKKIGF